MPPCPLWIACLPHCASCAPDPAAPWLARYGPHPVAYAGGWLLDLSASQRLFGGRDALLQRLQQEGRAQGWGRLGAALTALAALALAHDTPATGGARWVLGPDWTQHLDALPLDRLPAAHAHQRLLTAAGLHTLGDLRRCPRAALARRTAPALLHALDALYGQAPFVQPAWAAPARFHETLALPAPTGDTGALAFAGQRLIGRMVAWLQQRQAGVLHWRLGWHGQPAADALTFRHRRPLRDATLLRQLLQDALARTRLDAAVEGLWIETVHLAPWSAATVDWLAGTAPDGALDWEALLARLSSRLGRERVQGVRCTAHWDPAQRQTWRPIHADGAPDAATPGTATRASTGVAATALALASLWEPPWWLPEPQPLDTGPDGQPRLHGQPLRRLLGPQHISTGWWDTPTEQALYVAATPDGRCWWLRRQRGSDGTARWSLTGVYA